jgi:hypothetical protein
MCSKIRKDKTVDINKTNQSPSAIKENKSRNKQYQLDPHFTFHFIEFYSLDMFRALLAHPQVALHKRRVGDGYVRLCSAS